MIDDAAGDLHVQFREADRHYSFAPLMYWDDDMEEAEIARQLREMQAQHVHEAMIFPLSGMIQPYLSEAYFERVAFTLEKAAELGMRIWIYDEYNWPSGLAGGLINERHPEYLMTACRFYRHRLTGEAERAVQLPVPRGDLAWAEARQGERLLPLLEAADGDRLSWTAPEGEWELTLCVVHPVEIILDTVTGSPWCNNLPGYLDVMNPDAVKAFIELVYQGHYDVIGDHFGTTMPGFFSDEAGFRYDFIVRGAEDSLSLPHAWCFEEPKRHADPQLNGLFGSVPWTARLLERFQERHGYDLRPQLGELARGAAADAKVSYDYFSLISDLFAESYCEQICAWCEDHGVVFTGHWHEHVSGGDYYKQVRPMQVPGMDILGPHGIENRELMTLPRKIATIARMHGRERVMSETFSNTPWTYNLSDRQRDSDLLSVLGVNLNVSIDFTYSLRGFRKHCGNPPGGYQNTQWAWYRHFADHNARLSLAASAGEATVDVAILYCATAAVADAIPDFEGNPRQDKEVDRVFQLLMDAQIDADIVYESGLEDGQVEQGELIYPGARYRTLILSNWEKLQPETIAVLTTFAQGGGRLVFLGSVPVSGPVGQDLRVAWRPLFGDHPRAIGEQVETLADGAVTLVPDPAHRVTTSSVPKFGHLHSLFDGSDSLFVLGRCPQWLAIDLGDECPIEGLTFTVEAAKADVAHTYTIEVSANGEHWESVVEACQSGHVHRHAFSARARQLRLSFSDAGNRFVALTHLEVMGWQPSGWNPRELAVALAGSSQCALTFLEDDQPASGLTVVQRRVDAGTMVSLVNRRDHERHLRVAPSRDLALVEVWDLDSSERGCVSRGEAFTLSLAPHEGCVLLARQEAAAAPPESSCDRRRELVCELGGPWPFQLAKPNAYPLTLSHLQMTDPAAPDTWLDSSHGVIPEPLRNVPELRFRAEFEIEQLAGDEQLLTEAGIYAELAVNGQTLTGEGDVCDYMDISGRAHGIASLLRPGANTITGLYRPEVYERFMQGCWYHQDHLQPTLDAFVLGAFSVRGERLVAPVTELSGEPWEDQGYPHYSGTGVYNLEIELTQPAGCWLELEPRGGVVEVTHEGAIIGTRIAPPYLVDLSALPAGQRTLQVRVTNPIGSLLSNQGESNWSGNKQRGYASGLQSARLVHMLHNGE